MIAPVLGMEGALHSVGVGTRVVKATIAALDADFWMAERAALRTWYSTMVRSADSWTWLERLIEEIGRSTG